MDALQRQRGLVGAVVVRRAPPSGRTGVVTPLDTGLMDVPTLSAGDKGRLQAETPRLISCWVVTLRLVQPPSRSEGGIQLTFSL